MIDQENGTLMGISQFEIEGDSGYISDLREAPGLSDFEAMFILGRQTMNFIDLCGAHICYARDGAADPKMLSDMGFKEKHGSDYYCDMTGMFDGHCDGHAKKI